MSWQQPTTPNITDYLSFLFGVVSIDAAVFPTVTGTVTAGTTATLSDSTQGWTVNAWVGSVVVDTTQGLTSYVSANSATVLTVAPLFTAAPAAGDAYVVAPAIAQTSLLVATATVNNNLSLVDGNLYTLAVYNLGADRLINYAPDPSGQRYFSGLRARYRITDAALGIVAGGSDQGSSSTYLNPEQMRLFTLADMQNLKTPYGREYLGIAQSYGTLWGLT